MTTIACSLNKKKDKELIDFIEEQNNIGFNNSVLVKVALYNYMNATKMANNYMANNVSSIPKTTQQRDIEEASTKINTSNVLDDTDTASSNNDKSFDEEINITNNVNIDNTTNNDEHSLESKDDKVLDEKDHTEDTISQEALEFFNRFNQFNQ